MDAYTTLNAIFLSNKSKTLSAKQELVNKYKEGYKVVLFGAGTLGRIMLRTLENLNIQVAYFCDNNPSLWETKVENVKCISPKQLMNISNTVVCISSGYIDEIHYQLHELGMTNIFELGEFTAHLTKQEIDNIIKNRNKYMETLELLDSEYSKRVYAAGISQWFNGSLKFPKELTSTDQYFDHTVYKLMDNEVFVDAGAYNGDTIDAFYRATHGVFDKIIAFELNSFNYSELINYVSEKSCSEKILCYNKGLGNINSKIYYSNDGTASKISAQKQKTLDGEICRLDDMIDYASLIKMDIEGAELDALKGAERIVKEFKPRLAICIYHKPSDFFEIPLYIKQLVPEYKFAIRHYTSVETETILYAYI